MLERTEKNRLFEISTGVGTIGLVPGNPRGIFLLCLSTYLAPKIKDNKVKSLKEKLMQKQKHIS